MGGPDGSRSSGGSGGTGTGTRGDGAVDVVRVAPRRVLLPAVVSAVTLALLLVAVLKPWAPAPRHLVAATDPPVTAPVTPEADRVEARPTRRPILGAGLGEDQERTMIAQPLAGLDLSSMGVDDPHPSWGVVDVSAPVSALLTAGRPGGAAVSPLVTWRARTPTASGRAPTIDRPGAITVALAVTWPADLRPRDVRLLWYGPGPSGTRSGARAREIALEQPLPLLIRLRPPGLEHYNPTTVIQWRLLSGTFFLPPGDPPSDPAGWLKAGGWPRGTYAWVVTFLDGSTTRSTFVLAAH